MPGIRIRSLDVTRLHIPFTVAFRHASAERSQTATIWAEVVSGSGIVGHGESCPRDYVTGETLDTALSFAARHNENLRNDVHDLTSLRTWMASRAAEIDAHPAAWCAIELAILDVLAKEAGVPIEELLSLPPLEGRFTYTAVLGDASPATFHATADQYRRLGFADFKVKLCGDLDRDRAKVAIMRTWDHDHVRVRVDANNLWRTADEAVTFLQALDYPLFAVEEPLAASRYDELVEVGTALSCGIVLDESLLRLDQLDTLHGTDPRMWLINVRVSKMGGLLRSLDLVGAARTRRHRIVVGAQVGETSLLTRAALTVARAAGSELVAQEGAFGTRLLTKDVCDPPLMFGNGGILDSAAFPSLRQRGLGEFKRVGV